MFKSNHFFIGGLWLVAALTASGAVVTVQSGNGTIGGRDFSVAFLQGPFSTDFASPFTLDDFASAQAGPAAFIVSPNPNWISGLNEDASAKWIGTNANAAASGNTALYAAHFSVPTDFSYATLTLHYATDDTLAFANGVGGLFLNGTAICSSSIQIGFGSEHTLTCNNIGSMLHVGTNWLYFDAVNVGGAAGLIFSATITTTDVRPAVAISHVAVGDVWTTGFFVMNSSSQPATFSIRFYGDSGTNITLPFSGGLGNLNVLADTIPGGGMNYYEASGPGAPLIVGWASISSDPSITVQALFRKPSSDGNFFEASVTSSPGSSEIVIPFDATTFAPIGAPLATAFAVSNLDTNSLSSIQCIARDQTGSIVPNAVVIPTLNPLGHWAGASFPALLGKRGTIDCSANTVISAVAFRFIGNSVFSALPVVAK